MLMILIIIRMVKKSRNTKQKETIQESLSSITGFFSAEELYGVVNKKDTSIGIATVYRFLKEQIEAKNLHSYICDRRNVYSKHASHCHFICEKTGKVIHFDIDNLDFLKNRIPGKITSFQIEVRGLCDCKGECHHDKI